MVDAQKSLKKEAVMDLIYVKEKAQKHIDTNTVRFNRAEGQTTKEFLLSLRRRCVDGRYTKDQATTSFAFAGADVGIVMALTRASNGTLTATEAYKVVSRALKRLGTSFFYHTDAHAEHAKAQAQEGTVCFGCGHAKGACQHPEYGVDSTQQAQLIALIESGQKDVDMAPLEGVTLEGEHEELGVLVNTSENFTVLPLDEDRNEQFFIYDAKLIQLFLELMWEEMTTDTSVNWSAISKDEFIKSEGIQRDITVEKLATSKGKPTLVVEEKEGRLKLAA